MYGNDDEFTVRAAAGKAALFAVIYTILGSGVLMYLNRDSTFMMITSLIGVLVVVETITEMSVSKVEDKLLVQQLDLFSEVRHAYHETNMVEEAIYDASLLEESEANFQAEKIYNVIIHPDAETELEKYYDTAPNRFLKMFAGVSYLTREFGDRKVNGVSLYLKNMNNITQELQLEILKRDKIDYYFRSLSVIALAPILVIMPVKDWGESNFASTVSFYEGKGGFAMQVFILLSIFICYALLKKVKDNGDSARFRIKKDDPWQEKVYRLPIVEQFIDKIVPISGQKKYAKIKRLLKDAASHQKMEWLYVNRCACALGGFLVAIIMFSTLHSLAIQNVLEQATYTEKVMGTPNADAQLKAESLTAFDSYNIGKISENKSIIDLVRGASRNEAINAIKLELKKIGNGIQTDNEIKDDAKKIYNAYRRRADVNRFSRADFQQAIFDAHINYTRDDYTKQLLNNVSSNIASDSRNNLLLSDVVSGIKSMNKITLTDEQVTANAERIYDKIKMLTSETIQWFEILVGFLVAAILYNVPIWLLMFQVRMRKMDMEDEVMQYQTVILMLMHIERVSVEYILEWLERFANIFKEPISTCMNNYDAGAYEALEQLKDDAPYKPLVRIVESLQSAVENVKISDAFDELESDRNFFQERRKEANERLINKKAKLGRIIGFAPMVILFVGYLIGPLVAVSFLDMGSYFSQMGSMI